MKHWRLGLLVLAVGMVAASIMSRLFYVQVWNGKLYAAQALGQQAGFEEVRGERGEVFLQNSKESRGQASSGYEKSLAINEDRWTVYAIGNKIANKDAFATALSAVTGGTRQGVLEKLAGSDTYAVIKKEVAAKELEELKKLQLAGLYWERDVDRYYPQEQLASQVIGFVGGGDSGQYGIEGYYENVLKGKTGIREKKSGLASIAASIENTEEHLNGSNLYLTIDYNIQFQAEALLKEAHGTLKMDSGQIIVLKPSTGRVIALANYPLFNPNNYGREKNYGVFQNATTQRIFEPGSVLKPFTMAMALNEGKVSPESTFNDTGSVTIGPDTIFNFNREKYGVGDMSRILEKSINTGAVYLSRLISHQTYLDYLDKLGFTAKTGIDLQGEVYSRNDILKKGSDFGFATASFGQGIEMTPIQLARAFCVFANKGRMPVPYVVDKTVHGADEQQKKPKISDQIISEKTALEVTKMLTNVVERGFGDRAKIQGYYLAGKTGTAEVPIEGKKGYYTDRTVQSFIGYGPALKPEFLILVKLDNPKVPKSSLSAAPIFRKLAQYIINYWQIPPDY